MILCSGVLALASAIPITDEVGAFILRVVSTIEVGEAFSPSAMPPPMADALFRPLSVLAMKALIWAYGPHQLPGAIFVGGKAFFSALAFGLAARAWLVAYGMVFAARVVPVLVLLLPAHIYGLVTLTEFDGLAAAATLGAGALFQRDLRERGAWWGGILLALAAVSIKESAAVVQLAFLLAASGVAFEAGDRRRARAVLTVALVVGGIWAGLGHELFTGAARSRLADFGVAARAPIVGILMFQLVMLLSWAGVAALATGVAARRSARLVPAVFGLWLLAPPLRVENIFQTLVVDSLVFTVGSTLVLHGLLVGLLSRRMPTQWRTSAAHILVVEAALIAGILTTSSPREDMAGRLILSLSPMLFGLAVEALATPAVPKAARWVLGSALVSASVAGAYNTFVATRARAEVDAPARGVLAAQIGTGDVVAADHYVERLGPDSLAALGAAPGVAESAVYAYAPTQVGPPKSWEGLAPAGDGSGAPLALPVNVDVSALLEADASIWVYDLGPRSTMSDSANAALVGDFAWTRGIGGIYTPLSRGPRQPELPFFSAFEDARRATWGACPLDQWLSNAGSKKYAAEKDYVQIAANLHEIPWRLLAGVPIMEKYTWNATIWRVCKECAPAPTGAIRPHR